MIDIHLDPLREVRAAKRWALAGIGVATALLLPAYALLLGIGLTELTFVVAPAALTAFVGIELGSRWEYRMRRRYAYPQRLGFEMASIHDFREAGERAVRLVGEWLKARAVVLGWLNEDGQELRPVAEYGYPGGWLENAAVLSLGERSLKEILPKRDLPVRAHTFVRPWFSEGRGNEVVTLVPLVSRDRPEGVLAIATAPGNQLARDHRLLAALGMVMGLALDNSRLYEGQRAHTRHLHQLNRMKSDFLSTVSHELRTPLTSIMMAAEMLLEEEETRDPDSTRGRLVRNIVRGASRLGSLVSDLVSISREDEFQPRLELEPVPASELVANAVSIIQPLVAAKRQTIEVDLKASEATALVDRLRFDQVLINLLSNAQRYSPPGGHIRLSTSIANGEVIICVTDSGPGVPAEDRERIFEPFYRGDRSGLGLGLAIARSIVDLHNGRIWVQDSDGHGSAFCVAIATKVVKQPERAPSRVASR